VGDVKPNQSMEWTAVLFDFGGTLDAEGVAWKERFFRLWREEAGESAPEGFARVFYKVDDSLVGTVPPTLSLSETVYRIAQGVTRALGASMRQAIAGVPTSVARCRTAPASVPESSRAPSAISIG